MSAPATYALSPSLKATILNAFTGNDSMNATPTLCPTGNCTFSTPYPSLSMCHECEDITSLARPDCGPEYQKDNFGGSTLPGGLHLGGGHTGPWLNTTTSSQGFTHTIFVFNNPNFGQRISASWNPAHNGLVCSGNDTNPERFVRNTKENKTTGFYSLVAANCSLFPCVKHYTGEIENSQLFEASIFTAYPFGKFGYQEYDKLRENLYEDVTIPVTPCSLAGQVYTLQNISLAPKGPGGTFSHSISGESFQIPGECMAKISGNFLSAVESFMRELFWGRCGQGSISMMSSPDLVCTNEELRDGRYTVAGHDKWWLTTLFNNWNSSFTHIDTVFERIAAAITWHIRQNPGGDEWMFPGRNLSEFPNGPPAVPHFAEGVMRSTTVCVMVNWRWLFFHAGLIGLSLIPLVVMVVQGTRSRRNGRLPQWKSSLLPLIFHGLAQPPSSASPAAPALPSDKPLQPNELEQLAKDTMVEFRPSENGFKLTRVN
ncbi:hypothetical protein QBC34DRAFT_387781 [Podospora aff. communis PSN243]|uniref:Uncharacterized protein n=1 Tax=Podospora aff. communis PSN243 TaxID=3040156 RepID=A0AAV9FYN6_9PEZI|nr:hypothetical protein QBC34DRAFT_387781 [Podospora aff. communis PSN243]